MSGTWTQTSSKCSNNEPVSAKSCCLSFLHREQVQFGMQIVLSIGVSVYCMIEASRGDNEKVFIPILTGIIGYWLPAPRPVGTVLVDINAYNKDAHGLVAGKIESLTAEFAKKEVELAKKLAETSAENERLVGMYEKFQDREWDAHDDIEAGFASRLKKPRCN
jgi:hypothetical protein